MMLSREEFLSKFPNGPLNFEERRELAQQKLRQHVEQALPQVKNIDEGEKRRIKRIKKHMRQQFLDAGVPEELIDDDIGLIRAMTLEGHKPVPGHMLHSSNGLETTAPYMDDSGLRVFTQEVIDPATGQHMVVPFVDPESPRDRQQALSIRYGQNVAPELKQTEEVQKTIMKLMGINPQYHAHDPNYHWSDFVGTIDGERARIDGKVKEHRNTVMRDNIPVFQNLSIKGKEYYPGEERILRDKVDDLIFKEMRDRNVDVITAIDSLVQSGPIHQPERSLGKLMRNDASRLKDPNNEKYDYLLSTSLPRKDYARQTKFDDGAPLVAPAGAHLVDLTALRNHLQSSNRYKGKPGYSKLNVHSNTNAKGERPVKGLAKPVAVATRFQLDQVPEGIYQDVTRDRKYVRALQAMKGIELMLGQ